MAAMPIESEAPRNLHQKEGEAANRETKRVSKSHVDCVHKKMPADKLKHHKTIKGNFCISDRNRK